ncbi:7TM diverse intracellular signaling domain-containing protein [Desulfovibrio piger]|uniref:7TM diverse intracellular signaling domain-containing protein n=1 Tax=Desulfovibrio piger TaxID=901 RepID=UPI0026F02345|nr:7TM diverse intracellular signaling domain-containing protein [Desulfovibrio piger]
MTYPLLPLQAGSRRLALIVIPLLLVLSLAATCPAVPTPPPAPAPTPALPVSLSATPQGTAAGQLGILPYLSAFLDTDGDMSVEEVATPGMMPSFQPLHPRTLPRSSGVTWLRLEIPAAGTERTESLMLDLGQGVPAGAVLYTPDIDPLSRQTTWQESQANWRNLLPLPLPAETPQVCFIRLDGQPPLWFAPTLRSLDNLAGAPESLLGPGVMLALAVVMLLALLRGITERGQWRFWTALYVGAALTHAVLGGPDLGAGNITPADAVSAMAPGLALMFLAHLARHLMQTASHSRLLDIQYLLLSLPGAVLALLPLWPDFSWLGRFLPLWPMLALIFVPTTLGAWLMGVPGARRFLLGCLVAALGAGLAVLDLGTLLPPFVQGTLPLWGTALSALIIAGMSAPGREAGTSAEPADPLAPGRPARNQTITDPNLRLLDTDGNTLPLMTGLSQSAPAPATVEAESASATAIRRLEQALAAPLREIVEQNRQLEQCALPHDVRSRVENMGRRARQALSLLHDPAGDAAAPVVPAPADTARAEKRVFDLRKTLRQTHDTCRPLAEKSGIALGWHVPADLEQLYEGPAGELEDVLRLLLEDALRATKGGKIHFAVRRVPDSKHPGHLLFQVRDTGTGLPPEQRSASLLARIWELSSSHGGFLGVESGPRGTSVIFTLQLHLPEASDGEDLPTVLVCAPDAATRHELGAMLRDLPCTCHETGTLAHGLATGARKGRTPAAVLLVCGPEASVDAAPLLRRYHSLAERTGPFGAVALTPDQSQWDALAHAGFSHALTLPVSEDALRETVLEILGSHDDVADLGAPLPETRQADAPLPDLFGPAAAPQADQGMPDLLLSTDDIPQQTAPAAPAAASADLPDLFAAPAAAAADTAQAEPLPLTDDMRLDTPAAQTARPVADAAQPEEAAPADSPVQENENAPEAAEDVAPAPAPAAPDFPSVPVPETAETNEAAMPEAPVKEEETAAPAAGMTQEEPLPQQETADAGTPADAAAEALSDEMDSAEEAGTKAMADADVPSPARDEAAAVSPSAPAFPAPAREAAAEQALPADDVQAGDAPTDAAEAPVSDAVQPEEAASADSPVQENENAPEAAEDVAPAPAPAAPDFPSVPVAETAETNEAAMPEAPAREEDTAVPATDMTQEEPLPQQKTADADAPADAAAEALSDEMDSAEEAVAEAMADADVPSPARDEAAAVPPSAPAFPAPARETAAEQPLPADDVQTDDARADAAEAPVSDAAQPEEAAPADSPVQENENAPEAAEDVAPAPAPTAPDFPSVPVAETAETSEAAMSEAPAREEDTAVPATDMTREEPLPQQETADAAAAAPADDATGATVDEKERTEAPVADAQAASATRAPAFPSVEAAASPLAGGYVSPSLRHAGEWVGEPMPIGTPVDRPAPRQEETVSAPVETVVTVRPLRRDVSPDEIARKLGKPSLVPTDKSALITPQPRKSSSTGPGAGTQPAFPGAPVEEAPQAVPGSKDVSSLPDMTPDSTTLLASGREETSRTRAAANTLMRFLSRFHTGNGQPQDKEEARSPQAPAATAQERQGTPRPMPRKDAPQEETPGTTADIPATTNPWIERRAASRPVAPTPRMPVPPMPQRPQPPDDPEDPLPALMWRMDKYLAEAGYALEQRRLHLVADAAGRLAAEAESYGFRVLGRMARCVESAGRAKDLQAVTDLLPELATAVERHRISMGS